MNAVISATYRGASWLRGRRLATLSGIVLVAAVVAWLFTSGVTRQQSAGAIGAPQRTQIATASAASAAALDYTEIPGWHLFGQVAEEARPAAAAPSTLR